MFTGIKEKEMVTKLSRQIEMKVGRSYERMIVKCNDNRWDGVEVELVEPRGFRAVIETELGREQYEIPACWLMSR